MENIIILDQFFLEEDLEKIVKYFNSSKWKCQCINESNTDLSTDSPFFRHELKEETIFTDYLKNKLEKELNKKIKLVRMYSVGQMYAQDGNYHIDSEEKNQKTFVLYINKNYKEGDGGYIYLKIPNDNKVIAVEPEYNRGVLFPSNYRHKGMGYSKNTYDFRICIAWKFEIL